MSSPTADGSWERLLARAAGGDTRVLARLISVVEAGGDGAREISRLAWSKAGRAWVVGITGAAGAGKSTLANALVAEARGRDLKVAVVAVDPTSPLSGGAVLGDRARIQQHATDPGVFIRSMASRGRLGGLARATLGVVRLLDAAGWPLVLVETVGTGQAEVDVAAACDTCVVAVTPGWGDSLQVAKAGLMEVADLFVVNKADRPGAEQAGADLEAAVHLGPARDWTPPVLRVSAQSGEGVPDLWAAVERHRAHQAESLGQESRRRAAAAAEVRGLVVEAAARIAGERCQGPGFERAVSGVVEGRLDPQTAAEEVTGALPRGSHRPQPG